MVLRAMGRAHVDQCFHCGALYLDAGETDLTGLPSDELFGRRARPLGASERRCPCGARPMTRFGVRAGDAEVEVERSACCGGVFLDHGEHELLLAALPALDSAAESAAPFTTHAPTEARPCPRCREAMGVEREGAVAIDVCPSCGGLFLDPGEVEARGVDVSAVFGVGPEAAWEKGPSELPCPAHGTAMVTFVVHHFAGVMEIERAPCCGGLYFDGGEYDLFTRAARQAKVQWADRKYAAEGQVADPTKLRAAIADGAQAAGVAAMRTAADRAVLRQMRDRSRRHRRRGFFDPT